MKLRLLAESAPGLWTLTYKFATGDPNQPWGVQTWQDYSDAPLRQRAKQLYKSQAQGISNIAEPLVLSRGDGQEEIIPDPYGITGTEPDPDDFSSHPNPMTADQLDFGSHIEAELAQEGLRFEYDENGAPRVFDEQAGYSFQPDNKVFFGGRYEAVKNMVALAQQLRVYKIAPLA
jgi:hypothetical protein